ncbi:D-alanyl-D-alanine carboxypeptidase/D-alanyl-D-alanine-endopeptidase [Patulibacter americanus]|uniref:D-alanyl-D-alanine carboxypeptidase/D-alanyl-D-alanine-endopeptidase n=1 Tax=Patulibacter americanus TaxID=588672 RepID=UPI0003B6778E|nr:D-alanyl-D-alanine carboxypeptidase [Patulibacter americanus]
MPPHRSALAAAVATAASLAALPAAPAGAAMPSTAGLAGRGGVVVVDLASGRTLLDRRGSSRRIPASVTKVFTVAAALDRLGPDWAPRTRVVATGEASGRTWDGDLWLVGGGDPTLGRSALRALAGRTVRALGVTRLKGRLRVDATAFDDWLGAARTGRSTDFDMGGRLGALTVDRGAGTVDPAGQAGSLFRTALRSSGLRVTGTVAAGRAPVAAAPVATQTGPSLAELSAATLGPSDNFVAETLVKDVVSRDADEASCRIAGALTPIPVNPPLPETPVETACRTDAFDVAPATTASGTAYLRRALRPFAGTTPRIVDGSGLTRQNRVSPRVVVQLLQSLDADEEIAPVLRAGLAQAGRSGTLARRMRYTAAVGRCQAKTGTLIGVSALAGYCTTVKGREVAFAILQNTGDTYSAKRFEDRFVAALAKHG